MGQTKMDNTRFNLTWFGTACFGLQYGEDRILFDPFLQLKGGSYSVDPGDWSKYDTIFVTHCHFDHLYTVTELLEAADGDISVFCTKQCCDTLREFSEDQSNVVQIEAGRSYRIGTISINVLKGRHIEFQRRHILDTMSPGRVLRYASNLPFLYQANRIFQEAGESVVFDIMAGDDKRMRGDPVRRSNGKRILLLGSLALHPDETYPEGVDILILPYQGNNDLPSRAREVLVRLKPRSVLLSHFDNAFPPMSRNVDLKPLKRMMEMEFPDIRVVKPAAGKQMKI